MRYNIEVVPCKNEEAKKKLFLTKYTCVASDPTKNIVCIHGLTFSQHVFDIDYKDYSVARYWAKKGYTVWLLDAGGHGRSQRYKNGFDVTTASVAKDVTYAMKVMMETQGVDKVDLLGWSWGTMVMAQAAALCPEHTRKLVLVGPVTGGTMPAIPKECFPDDKLPIEYEFAGRLFRQANVKSGEVSSDTNYDFDITEPEVINLAMHNLLRYDMSAAKPQGPNVEVMCAGDTILIDGAAVKAPTLIIRGTDDIYSTNETVAGIMEKLPEGSESVLVRGAGHGFFFERDYYETFRETVLAFLEK